MIRKNAFLWNSLNISNRDLMDMTSSRKKDRFLPAYYTSPQRFYYKVFLFVNFEDLLNLGRLFHTSSVLIILIYNWCNFVYHYWGCMYMLDTVACTGFCQGGPTTLFCLLSSFAAINYYHQKLVEVGCILPPR